MLATHQFQEGLKNYRDLHYLNRNIEDWLRNVDVFENMLETRKEAYAQRLPLVEAALERADLDRMVESKLSFDSTVDTIESSYDWLSLAKKSEFDMWDEVTGLERSRAVQADLPEAAEVRDKVDLLKGVLQWNLERDFKERLGRFVGIFTCRAKRSSQRNARVARSMRLCVLNHCVLRR